MFTDIAEIVNEARTYKTYLLICMECDKPIYLIK